MSEIKSSKITKRIVDNNSGWAHLKKNYCLYVFLIPGLLLLLFFKYLPMGGLIIVFKNFSVIKGIAGSPWVGFDNFKHLFSSISFLRVLKNSLFNSFLKLLWSFPVPIILAILLNEMQQKNIKGHCRPSCIFPTSFPGLW